MKKSRIKTLLIGLGAGVLYDFLVMLLVMLKHESVSVSYIFVLPLVMGAIPVLLSSKEQLASYKTYLLWPWLITFSFFTLCWACGFEGMLCLLIIVVPFLLLGTVGAFVFRLIKLKKEGNGTKLYLSLSLPLLILALESNIEARDDIHTVVSSIEVDAPKAKTWENVKNVKHIADTEIQNHFIHFMGIPKPLNGELDKEAVGGIRHITWQKGIEFEEKITSWKPDSFSYDININPKSIPPTTLDEHVLIGGKYFDVLKGSYRIQALNPNKSKITLTCTYKVTTNLNFYSQWWADFILDDFHQMILEIIKNRSEQI